MNQQAKLLALLQVPQIGAYKIGRLLAEIDFAEFCHYGKSELKAIGWNEKQIQRWLHPDEKRIELALQWAEKDNQTMLTLFDDNYPFLLRQISTAPPVLFIRGNVTVLSLPQIAIVGSRDYSHYGEFWAKKFSEDLVKQGYIVTSGLAIGIDGICHQSTLNAGGITIAVLGSGLDCVYPQRHRKLAEQIIENGGALVSEFFPTQPPIAENFPRRNRIISGLSLGTLVIEATEKSGSLITARYAMEQGREVFALPNTVQNAYSRGCHKLIKEGALLTESVQDIMEAITLQQQPVVQPSLFDDDSENITIQTVQKSQEIAKKSPELTACQTQILTQISLSPISADDIAERTQLTIEMVLIELLNLELFGMIKQVEGGYIYIS